MTYHLFRPRPIQTKRRKFDRDEARSLVETGMTYRKVGEKLGVSAAAIYRALHWARDATNPKRSDKTDAIDQLEAALVDRDRVKP